MALGGVTLACSPAQAQAEPTGIEDRIANAFDLVEGNPLALAVPLARLALARRSVERGEKAAEDSQPIAAAVAGEPEFSATVVPAAPDDPADVEQGSAEGSEDTDIARLPRPRPSESGEQESASLVGVPLDLVAGAASSTASEPSPLLLAAVDTGGPIAAPSGTSAAEAAPAVLLTRELVASGDCMEASETADADGDFSRNAEMLSAGGFCIAETDFKERKKPWTVQTVNSGRPGPVWAVLHDDEDASFDNALKALSTYGGTLITVDTGGRRLVEGIDPNRNFSAGGIGCAKLGGDAAPRFTMIFRGLFDPGQPLIALHNNEDRQASTGGHGHASMQSVGRDMRASPAADQDGPLAGDDTLVLLAATSADDPPAKAATSALNAQGINVLMEIVRPGKGDCSFSNYSVLSGHTDYFNVTVGEGEGDKQSRIVDAIMALRPAAVATQ
jgi:hypothetical protein